MQPQETQEPIEDHSEPAQELATTGNIDTYTLAYIKEQKPLQMEDAIRRLSEGISFRKTAKATGLSRNVISQIAKQYQDTIGPLKIRAAEQSSNIATMACDAAEELFEKHLDPDDTFQVPVNMIPVYFGVFTEKALLLAGEATERKEVVERIDYTDFKTYWKEITKDSGEPIPVYELEPTDKDNK